MGSITPVDMAASIPMGLGAARMARIRSNWSSGMGEAQGLFLEDEDFLEGDFLEAIVMSQLKEEREVVTAPNEDRRLKSSTMPSGRLPLIFLSGTGKRVGRSSHLQTRGRVCHPARTLMLGTVPGLVRFGLLVFLVLSLFLLSFGRLTGITFVVAHLAFGAIGLIDGRKALGEFGFDGGVLGFGGEVHPLVLIILMVTAKTCLSIFIY